MPETITFAEQAEREGGPYERVRWRAARGFYGPVLPNEDGQGRRLIAAELQKRGLWIDLPALVIDRDKLGHTVLAAVDHLPPGSRLRLEVLQTLLQFIESIIATEKSPPGDAPDKGGIATHTHCPDADNGGVPSPKAAGSAPVSTDR